MKLEKNMYVKFKTLSNEVKIGQIQLIDNIIYELDNNEVTTDKYIIKASHNIIDLIQENDFVNGHRVISVDRESLELDIEKFTYGCGYETINGNTDIKSIVTKEQFESMKYSLEG